MVVMQRPRVGAVGVGLLVALTSLNAGRSALAQVQQPGEGVSAGENSGSLSDVSRPLEDSPSVHDGAQTIGETSAGSVHSGPVRDAGTRSMVSGPVSDVSRGPMYEPRPPLSGGSVTEASAGAVKHDIDSPLGERISSPLRELGPLQQAMRERRARAEQAALEGATGAAAPAIDPDSVPEAPVVPVPDAALIPEEPQAALDEEHTDLTGQEQPSHDADPDEEEQPAE